MQTADAVQIRPVNLEPIVSFIRSRLNGCSLIVPLTYRNPTPLIPPQLIHALHGGWLEQDKG